MSNERIHDADVFENWRYLRRLRLGGDLETALLRLCAASVTLKPKGSGSLNCGEGLLLSIPDAAELLRLLRQRLDEDQAEHARKSEAAKR